MAGGQSPPPQDPNRTGKRQGESVRERKRGGERKEMIMKRSRRGVIEEKWKKWRDGRKEMKE